MSPPLQSRLQSSQKPQRQPQAQPKPQQQPQQHQLQFLEPKTQQQAAPATPQAVPTPMSRMSQRRQQTHISISQASNRVTSKEEAESFADDDSIDAQISVPG